MARSRFEPRPPIVPTVGRNLLQTSGPNARWTARRSALATATIAMCLAGCMQDPVPPRIKPSDRRVVSAALDMYAQGRISRSELLESTDINVVHLPDRTCVGLSSNPESAGDPGTFCFDKRGRLVLSYRNGAQRGDIRPI
jgi:hypothetical protein